MLDLLLILSLTSSCNIVENTKYCTSTSTSTVSNCGLVWNWPIYSCSTTTRTSILENQTRIDPPPPAWVTNLMSQATGLGFWGWVGLIGESKIIAIPAYYAIKVLRRIPSLKESQIVSYSPIGFVISLAGMIALFANMAFGYFSVALGGLWLAYYSYYSKQRKEP